MQEWVQEEDYSKAQNYQLQAVRRAWSSNLWSCNLWSCSLWSYNQLCI